MPTGTSDAKKHLEGSPQALIQNARAEFRTKREILSKDSPVHIVLSQKLIEWLRTHPIKVKL